jgi:hypothetical protein
MRIHMNTVAFEQISSFLQPKIEFSGLSQVKSSPFVVPNGYVSEVLSVFYYALQITRLRLPTSPLKSGLDCQGYNALGVYQAV